MYAIIETGGKQLRVEEGRFVKVEKIEAEAGETVTIDRVLLVEKDGDVQVGAPVVDGATVACEVVEHGKHKKVIVFKKRRRQDSRCTNGHRQPYTTLKVTAINA